MTQEKEYKLLFKGRTARAIGIFYYISDTIYAGSYNDFVDKFWQRYEFYSDLTINGKKVELMNLEKEFPNL